MSVHQIGNTNKSLTVSIHVTLKCQEHSKYAIAGFGWFFGVILISGHKQPRKNTLIVSAVRNVRQTTRELAQIESIFRHPPISLDHNKTIWSAKRVSRPMRKGKRKAGARNCKYSGVPRPHKLTRGLLLLAGHHLQNRKADRVDQRLDRIRPNNT